MSGSESRSRPQSQTTTLDLTLLNEKIQRKANISLRPAVFLDRDGTISVEKGYIINPSDLELYPSGAESIQLLNSLGVLVIVVTNQAAIGKDQLTVTKFEEGNDILWNSLRKVNAFYDALYYCPHNPETTECDCRKPREALLLQAALDFGIDLPSSYLVGDKFSDIEAGQKCASATIMVLTGHGADEIKDLPNKNLSPDFVADALPEAVDWIIKDLDAKKSLPAPPSQ